MPRMSYMQSAFEFVMREAITEKLIPPGSSAKKRSLVTGMAAATNRARECPMGRSKEHEKDPQGWTGGMDKGSKQGAPWTEFPIGPPCA